MAGGCCAGVVAIFPVLTRKYLMKSDPCRTSAVRVQRGRPVLLVNERPVPGALAYCKPDYVADFAQAGIHLFTPDLGLIKWWLAPGTLDHAAIDHFLEQYVAHDPAALLIPRINLGYAEDGWWPAHAPGERAVARLIADNEPSGRYGDVPRRSGSGHSFASAVWLDEAAEIVRLLVEHCESAGYTGAMLGYHVCSGITQEWFAWNTFEEDMCEDYSPPMLAAYRAWLREQYGTDAALRAAWGDAAAALDAAAPPARFSKTTGA